MRARLSISKVSSSTSIVGNRFLIPPLTSVQKVKSCSRVCSRVHNIITVRVGVL